MPVKIEFWYEFASTYSYPAAMRAEKIAQAAGVTLVWQPFLLGPIFADLGLQTSPFVLQPVKGAYMWRDLDRICTRLGLPFSRPPTFPQNGLLAARIALALPEGAARRTFSQAAYKAEFAEGRNISDEETLRDALAVSNLDPKDWMGKARDPEVKRALKRQTEQAKTHGVFGAPSWRTADGELFWGNDRLEEALEWALAHADKV